MENVITLGKLIGLLLCSLPPLYFVFKNIKNTKNELARPVMGTVFLVKRASGAKGFSLVMKPIIASGYVSSPGIRVFTWGTCPHQLAYVCLNEEVGRKILTARQTR